MAKDKGRKVATITRAFMLMEASSFHGGFPAYMNLKMEEMESAMVNEGFLGPYSWKFSGGDGIVSPIHLHCTEK